MRFVVTALAAANEVLLFRLGVSEWALPAQRVRQALPPAPETRLPGADALVRGLVAWRGKVLPVLALGARLGCADPPAGHGHLLVIEIEGELAALPVDEVLRVAPASPTADGQVEVEGHPLPLLDLEQVLT